MANWKKSKPPFPLVFFGSAENSNQILASLLNLKSCQVVLAVTQPPQPTGRRQTLQASPVAIFAQEKNPGLGKR